MHTEQIMEPKLSVVTRPVTQRSQCVCHPTTIHGTTEWHNLSRTLPLNVEIIVSLGHYEWSSSRSKGWRESSWRVSWLLNTDNSNSNDIGFNRGVLVKLMLFAVSLAIVPITTFFGTQKLLWNGEESYDGSFWWLMWQAPGDSTFAAISAVFAANFVLVIYIAQSVRDDNTQNKQLAKQVEVKESQ